MNGSSIGRTQDQTAVASDVFRVIHDEFALQHDSLDLGWGDHSVGSAHLTHRVGEE